MLVVWREFRSEFEVGPCFCFEPKSNERARTAESTEETLRRLLEQLIGGIKCTAIVARGDQAFNTSGGRFFGAHRCSCSAQSMEMASFLMAKHSPGTWPGL
jgi:hypothetical protein